jgi:uncharacterized protein YjiK
MWLLTLFLFSCGPQATEIKGNTEGYDFEHPRMIKLPTALNEISGLWYYAKDSSLFAIVDEDGFLYKIFPRHPESILRWKFHGLGDFEDVTLVDNTFFILRSDGTIFATNISAGDNVATTMYKTPKKGNEFESLYYDSSKRLLILICKDCREDSKDKLSTWAFDPATRQFVQSDLFIDARSIANTIGKKEIRLKPSAALVNPFTNNLMLLSSVNELLVTTDYNGKVTQAYPLKRKLFKQPEGIAIGADRTLYISNEWAGHGSPNILVFPYNPTRK